MTPPSAVIATPTGPDEVAAPARGGIVLPRVLRRSWRQLTSMRTALVLLFVLAIAAIPGSLLPQRGLGIEKVTMFLAAHRSTGPWLDRLGMFDVYASPWFSAIYLLLLVSLVGCVLPRLKGHTAALLRHRPTRRPDWTGCPTPLPGWPPSLIQHLRSAACGGEDSVRWYAPTGTSSRSAPRRAT